MNSGRTHPSQGPGALFACFTVAAIIASLALANGAGARVLLLIFTALTAGSVWLALLSGGRRRTVWWSIAGGFAVAWAVVAVTSGPDAEVDAGRSEPSEIDSSAPPSTHHSESPESPVNSASSATSSPGDLPPALAGAKAPVRGLVPGEAAEFYGGDIRIGTRTVFDTWATFNLETSSESCDYLSLDVGQSYVIEGQEYDPSAQPRPQIIWYRLVLLATDGSTSRVRVERLISDSEPSASENCY